MKNYHQYIINKDSSCLEALKRLGLEETNQTLFVLDEQNILVGTITDGDIRRGLISGLNLESPILLFSQQHFSYLNEDIDVHKIQQLKKDGITILPKLTVGGKIEKIYNLRRLKSILPLHVVIMAGGKGERLRPLTDKIPKPILPLGNKTIIEHNIDNLISYGIETITISVRYLAKKIMKFLGDGSAKGITINYIEEDIPLGTIGCLSLIENFEYHAILILNSDIFSNIDFEEFYLNFIDEQAEMAVASIPYPIDIPYAILELKENNIISFIEKPKNIYYANAGIYIIKKECISNIPKNQFYNAIDLMDYILSNNGKLIHSPITGYWIDIGRHEDYNKAKEIAKHIEK